MGMRGPEGPALTGPGPWPTCVVGGGCWVCEPYVQGCLAGLGSPGPGPWVCLQELTLLSGKDEAVDGALTHMEHMVAHWGLQRTTSATAEEGKQKNWTTTPAKR